VIGDREASSGEVALRLRDGSRLDPMPRAAAIELIRAAARERHQAGAEVRARP
jgi:threonyl-tRNA synthetase